MSSCSAGAELGSVPRDDYLARALWRPMSRACLRLHGRPVCRVVAASGPSSLVGAAAGRPSRRHDAECVCVFCTLQTSSSSQPGACNVALEQHVQVATCMLAARPVRKWPARIVSEPDAKWASSPKASAKCQAQSGGARRRPASADLDSLKLTTIACAVSARHSICIAKH
jgi:hypothetical protein